MATNEKHQKNRKNITSKSSCFFTLIFLGFWSQLGWILASKLRPVPGSPLDTFSKLRPRGVQEAPKRLQERPKGVSRASNSLPRGPQECPRAIKTCPGHAQGASKGSLFEDFLVFQCFSAFSCVFCVFLCFSAFLCVFICFSVFFLCFYACLCIFVSFSVFSYIIFLCFPALFWIESILGSSCLRVQKFALPGEI